MLRVGSAILVQYFGIQHHLEVLYQIFSIHDPDVISWQPKNLIIVKQLNVLYRFTYRCVSITLSLPDSNLFD